MVNQLSGSETKEEPVEKPVNKPRGKPVNKPAGIKLSSKGTPETLVSDSKKPVEPVFQKLDQQGGGGILQGEGGSFFNLPEKELRELERRGKLPEEATQAGRQATLEQEQQAQARGLSSDFLGEFPTSLPQLVASNVGFFAPGTVGEKIFKKLGIGKAADTPSFIENLSPEMQDSFLFSASKEEVLQGYNDQITSAESIAGTASLIPWLGSDVAVFLGGDPERNVQELQSSIEAINQQSTSVISDIESGFITPQQGLRILRIYGIQVNQLQTKIQREIITSPALKASEQVTDISRDLLEVRQEIFRSGQSAIQTIAKENPDPADVLRRLQEER